MLFDSHPVSTCVVLGLAYLYGMYQLFFHIPGILHKKKEAPLMIRDPVVCHRGSRMEGLPENTLASFKQAVCDGATFLELDVWLTKDGEVVIHHDDDLARMTGGKCTEKICEVNYKDLPNIIPDAALDQADRLDCMQGERSDAECIPKLEEIFQTFDSNIRINIEFKQDSLELIEKVHDLVRRYERKESTMWFSLKDKINKKLAIFDPSIPRACSIEGFLKLFAFYLLGILPFMPVSDTIIGIDTQAIDVPRIKRQAATKDLPEIVQKGLAYIFQGVPPKILMSQKFVSHLHKRGCVVWLMGCNNEETVRYAQQLGVTGALTDKPKWLLNHMRRTGFKFKSVL